MKKKTIRIIACITAFSMMAGVLVPGAEGRKNISCAQAQEKEAKEQSKETEEEYIGDIQGDTQYIIHAET